MSKPLADVRTDQSLNMAKTLWRADVSSVVGRVLKWIFTLGFVGVIAAAALGTWRFSNLFYEDALLPPSDVPDPEYADGSVMAVGDGTITLLVADTATEAIGRDGYFGVLWSGGHGRVGRVVDDGDGMVVREFEEVAGLPEVGDRVTVNGMVYYGDPKAEVGIEFTEVEVSSELGTVPAWYVEGDSTTWVVFTHGKGVDRTEALRALQTTVDGGYPSLIVTYRNDAVTETDPSGIYQFGLTEWRDLQSSVQWALDQGAEQVVLVGYSMGGAITLEFMHRSPFSDRVVGLVLDAPMLDLGRTVDRGAEAAGVPSLLISASKTVAAMRFGLNWSQVNYLAKLDSIEVPVLVFHGTNDQRVSIELSEDLATALPDLVRFIPVEGAGHVESWNVDREAYETALEEFLDQVAG